MSRSFVWDPVKAEANRKKHGIAFASALRIFADPFVIIDQDRIEANEQRWQAIGSAGGVAILLVVHTVTDAQDGIEIIRIISARPAVRAERRRYENEARGI